MNGNSKLRRRGFLQLGGLGIFGLTLPNYLRHVAAAEAPKAKNAILVFLTGGPSHHDTFDPKPDAPVVWGKVLLWVALYNGKDAVPLKEEDYNERGELVRTLSLSDVKMLGGRLLPSKLECLSAKSTSQQLMSEADAKSWHCCFVQPANLLDFFVH